MKKIIILAFLLCSSNIFYGQHRVQISYDIPEQEVISWTADSIAPYKIIDGNLQRIDVYQCQGKSKTEIYNGVFSYLTNALGNTKNYVQEKDREAGIITVSWVQEGKIPINKILSIPYECGHVMTVETKEGRMRITHILNKLLLADRRIESVITESYPITPPLRKRPNNWEKRFPNMIKMEMLSNEILTQKILDSIFRENDEW